MTRAGLLTVRPLDAAGMDDARQIFGDCSYGRKCWCAYWYRPARDFKAGWGDGNAAWFADMVAGGDVPGLIAYDGSEPVAWVSVAPRERFDRLNRVASLQPVDDTPAWSINCFIVRKGWRRRGLMRDLIGHACAFIAERGGTVAEAYPMDANRKVLADELFVGSAHAFRDCGFEEVARRLPSRPIMRKVLAGSDANVG